jgi:hypothetical protein
MNDNFNVFVGNLGILCETWAITYEKFTQLGFDSTAAMQHTREFMTAVIASATQTNGGKNG